MIKQKYIRNRYSFTSLFLISGSSDLKFDFAIGSGILNGCAGVLLLSDSVFAIAYTFDRCAYRCGFCPLVLTVVLRCLLPTDTLVLLLFRLIFTPGATLKLFLNLIPIIVPSFQFLPAFPIITIPILSILYCKYEHTFYNEFSYFRTMCGYVG